MDRYITATQGTGNYQNISKSYDRIPEFDPIKRKHHWAVFVAYSINEATITEGKQGILDRENLMNVSPPGCYFCERPYSRLLAKQACTGNP